MAFNVRVTGPKFLSEESRSAFARIEDSVRQFSTHSRDTIILVRQPLSMARDHFAVLWSHGIAIVGFFSQSGTIRGSRRGPWTARISEQETRFENPFERLAAARIEFIDVLKRSAVKQLLETFFSDSPEQIVAALLDVSSRRLTRQELDRMAAMIEKAKKEGK